jgi:hypothetical protein
VKAVRIPTGTRLAPFGDPIGEVPVLNRTLGDLQDAAVLEAGLEPAAEAPKGEPYVVFSDRTWFTPELLRRVAEGAVGRLRVTDPRWIEEIGPTHDMPAAGLFEVGLHPAGPPDLGSLAPVDVPLDLEEHPMPAFHPSMAHASKALVYGRAMALQIDHWSHLLLANRFALARSGDDAKREWEALGIFRKAWRVLGVLGRLRSFDRAGLARAVCEIGKNTEIHPTAVVELSRLGDGVKVGPHAVVRGSILANGVSVDDHAAVTLSVLGERARVGRYGFVNLSVLHAGAMVSTGGGFQASMFGRDSFVAWGATFLDLSFGRTIPIFHHGERRDSGRYFLGAAIGHRARVMNGVRVNYGMDLPNDAFVVAPADTLLRDWAGSPPHVPVRVEGGRAVAVKKSEPSA